MEKRGYILDCFGTLAKPVTNEGVKLLLPHFESLQRKKISEILMKTDKSIEDILLGYDGGHIAQDIKENIISAFINDTTTLYPDAQRKLDEWYIFNTPFVVLSNISYDYKNNINTLITEPYGDKYKSLFDVLYSCEIGHKKPEPQAYAQAIQFFENKGINKDNITMIGDNPKNDYTTPLSLGIQAILLDRNGTNTDPAIKTITSFDKLNIHNHSTL